MNPIKVRVFPEHNYKGIHLNGKTIRIAIDPKKAITELKWPEFYDVKVTPYCKGNCPYCFAEGQKIKTLDGVKNIEEILIHDIVVNFDEEKSNITFGKVEQLHKRHYEGELIVIELENEEIIKCTPNHKFFVNGLWIEAENLTEKDILKDI